MIKIKSLTKMKSLTIYNPGSSKAYYSAFYELENQKKLKITLINSRAFYLLALKILHIISKNKHKLTPTWKDIKNSFLAPLTLLFKKNIIIAFNPYNNIIYYLIFLKLLNKNIIFNTSCNYWNTQNYIKKPFFISKLLWKVFLKNTKTIAPTNAVLESLKKYQIKPYYLPHSINLIKFKPKEKNNKKLKILMVSRLIPEKGIKGFIQASKKFPHQEFIIATSDNPNKIKNPNIKIIQINNHLQEIYNSADIFINNSYKIKKWQEWFGMTIIEAMASGNAVISTDCIGPKEIITHNKNGILIHQKNQYELEKAIKKLIENPSFKNKLQKNALKRAQDFNIKKLVKKAEKVI